MLVYWPLGSLCTCSLYGSACSFNFGSNCDMCWVDFGSVCAGECAIRFRWWSLWTTVCVAFPEQVACRFKWNSLLTTCFLFHFEVMVVTMLVELLHGTHASFLFLLYSLRRTIIDLVPRPPLPLPPPRALDIASRRWCCFQILLGIMLLMTATLYIFAQVKAELVSSSFAWEAFLWTCYKIQCRKNALFLYILSVMQYTNVFGPTEVHFVV